MRQWRCESFCMCIFAERQKLKIRMSLTQRDEHARAVIDSQQERLHSAEAHSAGLQKQLGFQVDHRALFLLIKCKSECHMQCGNRSLGV